MEDGKGGIAILETGKALGGGNLQNFLINSNTSADGFLQCLYGYAKKEKKRSNSVESKKSRSVTITKNKKRAASPKMEDKPSPQETPI